jgi:hypothetical protein
MQITIDTNGTLSDTDLQILSMLAGREAYAVDTKTVVTEPAEKPAPAKRPAPAKAKPAPEPEPEVEDDDLLGDTVTAESVMEKAAALVSKGKGALVKKALVEVGAGKVREVTADKLVQFNDLLDAI